jgi:hypothetical protein
LQKYFVGNRQFTYQQEKIPKKEIFRFKEASSDDWNVEVIYSGCVSNDSKNENQIAVDNITTDVLFALSNPSSDNKNVTDEGIFLISTRKVGSDFIINSMIQNGFRSLNNVFGFRNLFTNGMMLILFDLLSLKHFSESSFMNLTTIKHLSRLNSASFKEILPKKTTLFPVLHFFEISMTCSSHL